MDPRDAVKQLEYVFDANTNDVGVRSAKMYSQTFQRVDEEGSTGDLTTVACELGSRIRSGARPSVGEADAIANRVIDHRALTDGGD